MPLNMLNTVSLAIGDRPLYAFMMPSVNVYRHGRDARVLHSRQSPPDRLLGRATVRSRASRRRTGPESRADTGAEARDTGTESRGGYLSPDPRGLNQARHAGKLSLDHRLAERRHAVVAPALVFARFASGAVDFDDERVVEQATQMPVERAGLEVDQRPPTARGRP